MILFPFGLARNGGDAAVQLVGNDVELSLVSSGVRCAASAMPIRRCRAGLSSVRLQRIGGLLNAIMHELVGAIETLDQFETSRFPQIRVNLLLRCPVHESRAS